MGEGGKGSRKNRWNRTSPSKNNIYMYIRMRGRSGLLSDSFHSSAFYCKNLPATNTSLLVVVVGWMGKFLLQLRSGDFERIFSCHSIVTFTLGIESCFHFPCSNEASPVFVVLYKIQNHWRKLYFKCEGTQKTVWKVNGFLLIPHFLADKTGNSYFFSVRF